jgi:thiol-disulfide isomerase/thioredoxin
MLFTWLSSGDPNAPSIAWLTNEEGALAKARAEGKPVLIDFGATWCDGCTLLLDKNGKEAERLNDFVRPDELVAAMKCSAPARRDDAIGLR